MAAELSMNGRKKIETIQKEFTNKFNYLTLLFLDENRKSLDISKSLSEVRKVKGTDISINAGLKVNTLEARFRDNYGLMVEVAYMKDGKVLHTKDNVDKTLNEMNRWCEENGCDKFEFKKSLRGDTVLSLQEQLFNAISEEYPDAVAKKMNKDNFMDVHLPSVNAKKGTHIFFNTAKEGIKFGFYCRDEAFVKSVLDKSSNIEEYAQGVRPVGNPLFTDVDGAAEAALAFIGEMLGESNMETKDSTEKENLESDDSDDNEVDLNENTFKSLDEVLNDLKQIDSNKKVYLSVNFQTKPLYEKGKVGGKYDGKEFSLDYTRTWKRGYLLSDEKMTVEQLISLLENKKIEHLTSSDFLELEYGELHDYTEDFENIKIADNEGQSNIDTEELFSNGSVIGDIKFEFDTFDYLEINIFEDDYEAVISNKKEELDIEDFQLIHTLVILYSAFANQSGISDSSLDVLVERIQAWELGIGDVEKNTEIMKALRWFTNNYDASLFSKLKIKLNELSALSENNRKSILEDLRMISNTFFEMPSAKIQLYSSIITNLGFNTNAYAIEPVTEEMIENFNNEFDVDYKSTVLENLREDGYITLFSIDVKDLNKAIEQNDFSADMLNSIGKVELGDWDAMKDLTSAEEVETIMKDFNDVNPDYIVLLYCQGNYIHAFSSE